MKHLILILVAVAGFQATAQVAQQQEVIDICSQQTFDADKRSCFELMKGNLFDSKALKMCQRQTFDSEKRSCFEVIANKGYSQEMLDICSQQTFDADKRKCLRQVDSVDLRIVEKGSCSVNDTREGLFAIQRALIRGDGRTAEVLVRQMLIQLQTQK